MTRSILAALLLSLPLLGHAATPTPDPDEAAVKAVLASYKSALERRDLTGTEALFADANTVAESGKLEGSYLDYVAHHIGPELGHFERFAFSDYAVRVERVGDVAWATETYRYVIELKPRAEPIEGYMRRIFDRRSFQQSLTELEQEMRL